MIAEDVTLFECGECDGTGELQWWDKIIRCFKCKGRGRFYAKMLLFICTILFGIVHPARSAEVYVTDNNLTSNVIKVFITQNSLRTDLVVYITDNQSQATHKDYVWHYTSNPLSSTVKIIFLDHEEQGCLRVKFTDNLIFAGWKVQHHELQGKL